MRRLEEWLISAAPKTGYPFYIRLVGAAIAKQTSRNLVQDIRETRALLFNRNRVVHVLVAEVLHGTVEILAEDNAKTTVKILTELSDQRRLIKTFSGLTPPLNECEMYLQTLFSPTSSAISMLAPSIKRISDHSTE